MNEELLKIVIRAEVKNALEELKRVNEEIERLKDTSDKSAKGLGDSMKTAAKNVAKVTGAITAATVALVAFGKSTVETQKEIGRLNTAFQAAGKSTKQAEESYRNIFGFLGDSGAAVEAAQQLAQIPTDDLATYEKILQGVYATFGTSIETGGLAEAINHTIQLGEVQGTLADAFEFAGVSIDGINAQLATFNSASEREAYLRSTLIGMYGTSAAIYGQNNAALISYNQSQASLNIALANAGKVVLPLMTAFNNLAITLLTSLKPALEIIVAALVIVIQAISTAIGWISSFFSIFTGGSKAANTTKDISSGISSAANNAKVATGGVGGLNKALDGAAKSAKELKKQTMGFDELNVVSDPAAASGGDVGAASGGGGGFSVPDMSALTDFEVPGLEDFNTTLEEVRGKMEAIAVLAGLTAAAFLAWKLVGIIQDAEKLATLLKSLQTFGGVLMIIAGAFLLIAGYTDAWVNGIDWGNFAAMLAGVALIIGGIYIAVGPLAAGIAAIAGGVALVVIGIKDFVTNGYSMQAVLTILAGVIAIVVGVCLAFNAALLANPITWIIIAIAALVAAFVILWNECDGFRNFWIMIWEKVKKIFSAFVESLKPLIDAVVGAFQAAWELIKVVWNDYLVPLFKAAWEAIKAVWDMVKPYFAAIWEGIKAVFSVVVDVLGSYFKMAWEVIQVVWNVVVSYFTAIWDSIAGVFSVVKDVLSGNFKGAWEGIKGIVDTWIGFFKGVWEGIKKVFSSVATFFKDIFSKAWEGVLGVFSATGKVFKGIAEGILAVFKKVVNFLIDGINKVVKKPFEGLNKILNTISGLEIAGFKPFSWLTWRAPIPQLPKLAKGGIVDSTTIAMIGEAGKEAVVPLENNTEWMDTLADRLAERNGSPSKIVLMLDGKELGWATINSINGITRQTGNLQLNVI